MVREELRAHGPHPDPWAKFYAWRFTGPYSKFQNIKQTFPGLGIAIVAFTAYVIYDDYIRVKDVHHHEEQHHDAHSSAHH